MTRYICSVCGFVYDPAIGLPDEDIPPGTPFESLPDDWICPECGVSKADFSELED
ncbi:rubredoxin [Magnetospirillum molischianum]|uniref:Rubredoxin n=1 Tax=Magnetospirillum molischianum DSM 120 TaxID=1150626 RepID=H8FMJ8_MAGML|nr:rubredoxin [Magnetospirillum molischianum]CCG39586.1 Rubredoxin [Magnetospirillum molischianum DSM 120]